MTRKHEQLDLAERHQFFLMALARGNRDAAMRHVEVILTEYPQLTGKYYALMASNLAQQGQFELAAYLYERAIAFDPDDTIARLYLGAVLQRLGRESEACALWAGIAISHPERPEARLQLVFAKVLDGDLVGAREMIRAFLTTLPSENPLQKDARLVFNLVRHASNATASAVSTFCAQK